MTFQTATLTGTYQKLDGTPASGLYEIKPNSPIIDQTGNVIRSGYQKGSLDEDGHFSVVLPATDDATLEPATDRQYTIIVKPNHSHSSVPVLEGIELLHGQTYDTADLTSGVVAAAAISTFLTEEQYLAAIAALQAADTTNASAISAEASLRVSGDAASVATAAADATTKANAAQAAAVQRANHTGTQSADTLTDGTTNKAFLATERTKLSGVAAGATANDTDANLKARVNHTGTQAITTVTGVQDLSDSTFKTKLDQTYLPSLVPSYAAPRTRHWFPKASAYNLKGSNTRRLRAALSGALAGTGLCKIACAGASNTAGAGVGAGNIGKLDIATQLHQLLVSAGYPAGGTGFVYAENNLPVSGFAGFDYRLTLGGTWVRSNDPSLPYLFAAAAGRTITFVSDVAGTVLEILTYDNAASATFTVTVDGALQSAWTPGNTNAVKLISYTGLSNTTHTVLITTTSSAAVVGLRVRQATGVDVTNAGVSGSTAGNWLTNGAVGSWIAPLSVLKAQTPDAVFLDLYGNEALQDIAAATFQTNLASVVSQIQAIGADAILVAAPEPNPAGSPGSYTTTGITQAKVETKIAAAYNVADSADVPLIDETDAYGLYAQANTNGLFFDAVHINEKGTAARAQLYKGVMA